MVETRKKSKSNPSTQTDSSRSSKVSEIPLQEPTESTATKIKILILDVSCNKVLFEGDMTKRMFSNSLKLQSEPFQVEVIHVPTSSWDSILKSIDGSLKENRLGIVITGKPPLLLLLLKRVDTHIYISISESKKRKGKKKK